MVELHGQVLKDIDGAIVEFRNVWVSMLARVDFEDQLFRFADAVGVVHTRP